MAKTETFKEINKAERIRKAEDLFMQGFNCSQSVVGAFADIYGYTTEQALKMSAAFGGGIGRMRLTCGAACGMFMLAGMENGSTTPGDRVGKSACYKDVQELAQRFTQEHGSICCAELLQLKKGQPLSYEASERTAEYYRVRPCVNQIVSAAKIFAEWLETKRQASSTAKHQTSSIAETQPEPTSNLTDNQTDNQ